MRGFHSKLDLSSSAGGAGGTGGSMLLSLAVETERARALLQTFSSASLGAFCVLADHVMQLTLLQQQRSTTPRVLWLGRLKDSWCSLPWLLFISLASHHIRDGVRRGLWVCPFGNTAPISYWLYVIITATLPHLCSVL
ncbi:unnamed protein product, partial [Coregonus sp. 'balchen']